MMNRRPGTPPQKGIDRDLLCLLLTTLLVVALLLFWAYNEAASFNRFTTGPKATLWDALFVELRVEAQR